MEKPTRTTPFASRNPRTRTNLYALKYYLNTDELIQYKGPQTALEYWRKHVTTDPEFDPDYECFVILWINMDGCIKGHVFADGPSLKSPRDHAYDMLSGVLTPPGLDSFVILQHHASSEPKPTQDDFALLYELNEEAAYQCAEICDYILMGKDSYCCIAPDSLKFTFTKVA